MNYLFREIELMRPNPAMYLGRRSITALADFINGFTSALALFADEQFTQLLPLPFYFFFCEFTANYFGWNESTAGWRNIILEEAHGDEEAALFMFYEVFDKFRSMAVLTTNYVELNSDNVRYHYENQYAPKQGNYEPLYIDPSEVYIFEMTNNGGFVLMVNTPWKYRLHHIIFKDLRKALKYAEKCFGSPLEWRMLNTSNFVFDKPVEYLGG